MGTLNINGITSPERINMLNAYIRIHNFDVLLIQVIQFSTEIQGHKVHYNIGTYRRRTAFLARDTIPLSNISELPSERAIAAYFDTLYIINIYVPSSTSKRTEKYFITNFPTY